MIEGNSASEKIGWVSTEAKPPTTYSGPSCLRLRSFFFKIHSRDLTVGRVCFLPKKMVLYRTVNIREDTDGAPSNVAAVLRAYPSFRCGRAARSERIWHPPLPVLLLRLSWPAALGPRRLQRDIKISCGEQRSGCEADSGVLRQPAGGRESRKSHFFARVLFG